MSSNQILAALGERARSILKALSPEDGEGKDAPVPVPPPDPDALPADTRIAGADASPKEEDLDAAGEAQAAAQPDAGAPPAEGGEPGGEPDGDESETDEEGRPVQKALAEEFDAFGNRDLSDDEVRTLLKSYGVTPPTPEDKVKAGGVDVESVLEAIMQGLERQNEVISHLSKEVQRLRASNAENERSIAKALGSLEDPRFAPAAPPRAITKALPAPAAPAGAETELEFSNRIFADMRAGRITDTDARAQIREFKSLPR